MMQLLINLGEFLIFTVIVKGIIAHSLADYILKYAKRWVDMNEERRHHYNTLVARYRQKLDTM